MAITKINPIHENKDWKPKHLKVAIDYICNPEKTYHGKYVQANGCISDFAFDMMMDTKKHFSKTDKVMAYHIILSFKPGEVDPDTAFKIVQRFVNEYLKGEYETIFTLHTDTDHLHGHIIFNSVNRFTGKKFQYWHGEWANTMQPLTNRLCEEYGLSTIDIEEALKKKKSRSHTFRDKRGKESVFAEMIRRDIDGALIRSLGFDDFLSKLANLGYEVKYENSLSIRPMGMKQYYLVSSFGEHYTNQALAWRSSNDTRPKDYRYYPRIIRVKIPYHLKRAALSGVQRRYYKKLYETGQLKKRPYSQVWRYRKDIREFHKLQEQYLFLARYEVHGVSDLIKTNELLKDKKRLKNNELSRIYKERARFKPLFEIVKQMEDIEPYVLAYIEGDEFFTEYQHEYEALEKKLADQGYDYGAVKDIEQRYRLELAEHRERFSEIKKDLKICAGLLEEAFGKNHYPEWDQIPEITDREPFDLQPIVIGKDGFIQPLKQKTNDDTDEIPDWVLHRDLNDKVRVR